MIKRIGSVFDMIPVSCQFDFHPVGQGLFYSGRINDFHFVYDCGTVSRKKYMNAAIDAYVRALGRNGQRNRKPLDMLVISHFHGDHMNGVKDLLKRTKGVKEVVLPYLHPAERLLVAAEYAINNKLDALPEDYIAFLADPAAYFGGGEGSPEATIVTFILPGGPVGEWGNAGERGAVEQPGGAGAGVRYGWLPDIVQKKEIDKDPALNTEKVKLRTHASIFYSTLWSFKFYCRAGKATMEDIEAKLRALERPIGPSGIEASGLAVIIRTRLDDLKKIYRELFSSSPGQNSTSLVCCHGPAMPLDNGMGKMRWWADILIEPLLSPQQHLKILHKGSCQWVVHFFHRCRGEPCHAGCHMPPPFYQMLFGDANPEIDEYNTHFQSELQEISVALLPHHGANSGWHGDLPRVMPNCSIWVASFGLGNQYGHPCESAVSALKGANREILLCTQVQGWSIAIDWRTRVL